LEIILEIIFLILLAILLVRILYEELCKEIKPNLEKDEGLRSLRIRDKKEELVQPPNLLFFWEWMSMHLRSNLIMG
jgi:hypothetical protein